MKKVSKRGLLEKRRTIWEKLFFAGFFVVLCVWSFIMLYMLFWAVISAFKTNMEYVNEPLALPVILHFENFQIAMSKLYHNGVDFWGMLYNSIWQTILPTLIGTSMTCIIGYIFAHYEFKGKGFLFGVIVFTMIIPIYGSFASEYKLNFDLGLNDSYLWLIRSLGGFGGGMLYPYGYYKAMPKEMREAVYMDGGSDYVALWKVYFPLGRNIFVALSLLGFIGAWNDYTTPLLYMDKMPPLALGLYNFQQEILYVANTPAYFAGTLIVMLPILLLFIFYSDKIMGQLFSGGLKG